MTVTRHFIMKNEVFAHALTQMDDNPITKTRRLRILFATQVLGDAIANAWQQETNETERKSQLQDAEAVHALAEKMRKRWRVA